MRKVRCCDVCCSSPSTVDELTEAKRGEQTISARSDAACTRDEEVISLELTDLHHSSDAGEAIFGPERRQDYDNSTRDARGDDGNSNSTCLILVLDTEELQCFAPFPSVSRGRANAQTEHWYGIEFVHRPYGDLFQDSSSN